MPPETGERKCYFFAMLPNTSQLETPVKKQAFAGQDSPPSAEDANQRPPLQTDHPNPCCHQALV